MSEIPPHRRRWAWRHLPSDVRAVFDKNGRRHRLCQTLRAGAHLLELYQCGWFGFTRQVGRAFFETVDDGSTVVVHDIEVLLEHQSSGLGSQLLSAVIEHARKNGARRICGRVTQSDLAKTPHLIEIYQRRGFEILPPASPRDAAQIELIL